MKDTESKISDTIYVNASEKAFDKVRKINVKEDSVVSTLSNQEASESKKFSDSPPKKLQKLIMKKYGEDEELEELTDHLIAENAVLQAENAGLHRLVSELRIKEKERGDFMFEIGTLKAEKNNSLAELNSLKFPVDFRIIFDQVEQRYYVLSLIVCFC